MRGDKLNPNEYAVYEKDGTRYSQFAATYTLRNGIATFWYWRKNIVTRRYELLPHKIENVDRVILTIDGEFEK